MWMSTIECDKRGIFLFAKFIDFIRIIDLSKCFCDVFTLLRSRVNKKHGKHTLEAETRERLVFLLEKCD